MGLNDECMGSVYGESRREEGTRPPLVEKQLERGCEEESMVVMAIRGNCEGLWCSCTAYSWGCH